MIDCIYLGERGRCKRRKGFHVLGGFCAICEFRKPRDPDALKRLIAEHKTKRRGCTKCQEKHRLRKEQRAAKLRETRGET